jgi:hypothetical protein
MTNMIVAFALLLVIGGGVMWLLRPSSGDNKPSGFEGQDPIARHGLGPSHHTSSTSHDSSGSGSAGGGNPP